MRKVKFERAIFISWYCSIGDCTFCYMSTQKNKITDPKRARRTYESIFAEAYIAKKCGWGIEFIAGGYNALPLKDLLFITKTIAQITGQKQWLNIGAIREKDLQLFLPYIEGVSGSLETINPAVHKKVCPSKPASLVLNLFKVADKLGLKKSITIILGLGETEADIPKLIDFIKEHNLSRITFYRLNPHEGTAFTKQDKIKTEYYVKWISAVHKAYPNLEIIAGTWVDFVDEIPLLIKAGATHFTKYPALKLFNSTYSKKIEAALKENNLEFQGTLTKKPKIEEKDIDGLVLSPELKQKIKEKVVQYLDCSFNTKNI